MTRSVAIMLMLTSKTPWNERASRSMMDRRAECWDRRLKKSQALRDKVEENDLVKMKSKSKVMDTC